MYFCFNRRNMEPLDDVRFRPMQIRFFDVTQEPFDCMQSHFVKKTGNLRLRGSGDNPSLDNKFHDIPYLSKMNFMWNGLPCVDFDEKILNILNNGLGSMDIKGGTLLATVRREDPGGVLGNPPRATAPNDIVEDSHRRNNKAFCCILNYIDPKCELYKHFMREFQCDGVAVYVVIRSYGPVPTPPKIIRAREDAWSRMNMDVLRIQYTITGFFMWAEMVTSHGRKLGKDGNQMRDKFVEGLPSFFDAEKSNMRHDARFVYPATWAGVPGYASTSIAGNAHPLAGDPDHSRMAKAYLSDWITKSSSVRKQIPHGMVRSVDEAFLAEPDEVVELLAKDINKDTSCFVCGGKGHAASQFLPNGEKVECANKKLNKESDSLFTRERTTNKSKRDTGGGTAYETDLQDLQSRMDEILRLQQTQSQVARRRTKPQNGNKAFEAEVESDGAGTDTDASKSACMSAEDDEEGSDASTIHDFAEVVQPSRSSPFRRKPTSLRRN